MTSQPALQTPTPATARSFRIDASHSSAEFAVKHLMISTVKGTMGIREGSVSYDAAHPERARVEATLDVATLQTGDAQRDGHLRSPDFLDAAAFPTVRFVATDVQGGDDAWRVQGALTIRDVTHPVTLEVENGGEGGDPWGNHRVGLSATTTIDRTQWGLTWNKALETGGVLVGDKVKVTLHLSLVENK